MPLDSVAQPFPRNQDHVNKLCILGKNALEFPARLSFCLSSYTLVWAIPHLSILEKHQRYITRKEGRRGAVGAEQFHERLLEGKTAVMAHNNA